LAIRRAESEVDMQTRAGAIVRLAITAIIVFTSATTFARSTGFLVAWGDNTCGQCDMPPLNVDFVAVDGGYAFSLGLTPDGTIVAVGDNSLGQLNVPAPNGNYTAIAAGPWHALAILRRWTQ
jgi:hypothetical protein